MNGANRSCLVLSESVKEPFDKVNREIALCNKLGSFECEGRYDVEECKYNSQFTSNDVEAVPDLATLPHQINPYESAEARIMFSTWNLDHV